MIANQRCLIAVDLDSTILSDYFSLSARSVRALIRAQNEGHIVMIATARPEAMALPYHRAMGFHGPISTLNGAYLYHPDDPAFPRYAELISAESMAVAAEAIRRAGVTRAWVELNDHVNAVGEPTGFFYFEEVFRQSGATLYPTLPAEPGARLYCCIDTAGQAEKIHDAMRSCKDVSERYYVTPDGEHRLNYNAATADKWYAVRRAADWYGIPNENIITFGDAGNDAKMISNAGHGFVLRNAEEQFRITMVKSGAAVTELTCPEGGVGREIEKLLF